MLLLAVVDFYTWKLDDVNECECHTIVSPYGSEGKNFNFQILRSFDNVLQFCA